LAQGVSTDLHFGYSLGAAPSPRHIAMRVLAIAASCAAALVSVDAACFVANTVLGQDSFQAVNAKYVACKDNAMNISNVDQVALCTCAQNQLTEANGCSYDWINPWISTVRRDKAKFCGQSSSVSSAHSSMSGSDASLPSLGTSSDSSGTGMSRWTTTSKAIFWSIVACLILGIVGGVVATMLKGKKKSSKKGAPPPVYEDQEQQQFEQQYQPQEYVEAPQEYQEPPQAAPEEYYIPEVEAAPMPALVPLLAPQTIAPMTMEPIYMEPIYMAPQTIAPVTMAPMSMEPMTILAPQQLMPPTQFMAQPQYATTYAQPMMGQPIMGQFQFSAE